MCELSGRTLLVVGRSRVLGPLRCAVWVHSFCWLRPVSTSCSATSLDFDHADPINILLTNHQWSCTTTTHTNNHRHHPCEQQPRQTNFTFLYPHPCVHMTHLKCSCRQVIRPSINANAVGLRHFTQSYQSYLVSTLAQVDLNRVAQWCIALFFCGVCACSHGWQTD